MEGFGLAQSIMHAQAAVKSSVPPLRHGSPQMSSAVQTVKMQVRLIDPKAQLPTRTRTTDAGYDIYSIQDAMLAAKTATIVRTGIQISAPHGYYYTIEGRSSLWSRGIFPNRGIIDSTFCGELVVSLVNVNDVAFEVKTGDRIAQIILAKQYDAQFELVDEFSAAYNQRGINGFGSTGR
jgi:dUTP pyrophosphatase